MITWAADRRVRERRKWWLAILACAGMLAAAGFLCYWVMGCVKVQVGPATWEGSFLARSENNGAPTYKPSDYSDLPNALISPASQPSDIQTPQEIIDELFGDFEADNPAPRQP